MVVNISRKHRMPIIPYSGGTSLEGHTRGVRRSTLVGASHI
jgi:FAD/FMN-containing dehydrogenase